MTGPSAAPGESRERQFSRLLMALAAVTAAIVAPVAAAIAVGGEAGNPLNLALEGISSASSGLVRDVRVVLPIGFAFAAGMASALNPCAFFLIPAYLGLYMHEGAGQGPRQRAAQGLTVAATVAVSFIVLFAVVGSAVGLAASLVIGVLPIVALAVGLGLILAGAYRINGGSIHALAVQRLSVRLAPGTGGGLGRYFLFGLAYGAASLSCTLPVFLAVVGSALTSGGVLG